MNTVREVVEYASTQQFKQYLSSGLLTLIFGSLAILILHPIYTVLTGGILFETVGGILLLGVHFSFGFVWCCAYIMHLLAEYHTDSMVVNWDG